MTSAERRKATIEKLKEFRKFYFDFLGNTWESGDVLKRYDEIARQIGVILGVPYEVTRDA